jgi:hypothetical protein
MNENQYVSLAVLTTIQEIVGRVMRNYAGNDFAERSEKDLPNETAAILGGTIKTGAENV